ncbi:MAG TPA: AraC family transcriptional regulator, partial [Gemmatimonadaceae bacterium]|nr:AraC family transcriptional regulator [Gemmatimonadaceae bacterium]
VAHRIHDEFAARDAAAPLAIEGLLLELLAVLSRRAEARRAGAIAPWLRRAREMIHADFAGPLALADVARAVEVHPVTLARGYRQTYGETVGACIRRLRIEHAATALRDTAAPLSEIALVTGFADQAHFSNVFRRHTGLSPRQYRAAAKGV